MMTLIEQTEKSAKYQFTHLDCTRIVNYVMQEEQEIVPDFQKIAEKEYDEWLTWLNEPIDQSSPISSEE